MQGLRRVLFGTVCSMLLSTAAYAQASIAGVVKDTSGAVLPGVTVEAASPGLIEKVRSVVTDGTGQYRIVDLRPGTYAVTFTLPGFSTRQARRHRADRVVHRDGQRRAAGRRARGDASPSPAKRRSSTCRASRSSGCIEQRGASTRFPPAGAISTARVLHPGAAASDRRSGDLMDVGGTNNLHDRLDDRSTAAEPSDQRVQVDGIAIRNLASDRPRHATSCPTWAAPRK